MIRFNGPAVTLLTVSLLVFSCGSLASLFTSPPLVVTDRSDTRTPLSHARLEGEPRFQLLLGGGIHEIRLKDVRLMKIDPGESTVHEGRVYYAVQVILKDGSVLAQSGAPSLVNQCFLSLDNTLCGNRKGERVRIPLQNIMQIKSGE